MKVLVIGKPTYNTILPVNNFISEGSKTNTLEKLEMAGGATVYAASLLGKWKLNVSYAGVVGSDKYGNKIKEQLESFQVDTKYIEINYEHPTSKNFILINKSNGSSTEIFNMNPDINLTRYKYDFIPDFILMDGTDPAGSLAALNNFPQATSILFANRISELLYDISKKCTYVIANPTYASALTKMTLDTRPKALVDFMQKIKDFQRANYIIMMQDKGSLYTSDNQVKMIPVMEIDGKVDDTHSGYIFLGAFAYGMINNYGIDNAVKIANIAAALSLTKMGTLDAILDLEEVLSLAGLKEIVKEEVKEEPETPEVLDI